MTAFILMGISGSGKTTVGRCVAAALHIPFIEGDDYHPETNIAKMSAGIALTDRDRGPWIDALCIAVNACESDDVIVACSALTAFVRQRLRASIARPVVLLHLTASKDAIAQRLAHRTHFMKATMLDSQLAALDPPADAMEVDAGRSPGAVTQEIIGIIHAAQVSQRTSH